MQHLKGQHVLILGLGTSGLAMAKWCLAQGASVSVADTRTAPPGLATLTSECPGAKFISGPLNAELLQVKASAKSDEDNVNVRAVFKSPGLAPAEVVAVWDAAKAMGLWVGTELSLFIKALAELKEEIGYEPSVLAVTGTNGKTTVTSLTAQMLVRGGLRTVVAGNIGPTLLGTLSEKLAEIKDIPEDEEPEETEVTKELVKFEQLEEENAINENLVHAEHAENDLLAVSNNNTQGAVESKVQHEKEETALKVSLSETAHESKFNVQTQNTIEEAKDDQANQAEHAEALSLSNLDELTESHGLVNDLRSKFRRFKSQRNALPQAWVLELSSFQLNDCEDFDPTASVILNISEDHLDWHIDMPSYIGAKSKVFGQHTHQILCRDDPQVLALRPVDLDAKALKKAKAEAQLNNSEWFERDIITYGSDVPSESGHYGLETVNGMTWLVKAVDPSDDEGDRKGRRRKVQTESEDLLIQRLMPADALRIRGAHNALNALAALALSSTAKATSLGHGPMLYALREYKGEPHRVEPVVRINDVEYFDDSKGTNVGATLAAINGLGPDHRLIVILGGEGKGQDFTPLAAPLARYAKLVILLGRDAPIIKNAIEQLEIQCIDASSMDEAVKIAHEQAQSGDAVLMSPACASFDMFDNYEHRAKVFVEAVRALALEEGVL